MNTNTIITLTLGLLLFPFMAACQKKEAANSGPSPALATDTDLGHGYVRRDGNIHFIGGGVTGAGAYATRIDTPSPKLLKKVVDSQFGPFKTAEGLDVASFEALSEEYTRDKNRVYLKVVSPGEFIVIVLPEADPNTFEVIARNVVRDRNHVWYYDRIQRGVDPSTLELVDGGRVFKDKDSVHYQHDQIAGADPATFRHLGSGYYADRSRVYWCKDPIPDADPATFEVFGDSFIGKDNVLAYRSGEPLKDYDVESLELILHDESGYQVFSDRNGIHMNKMTFPRSKPGKVEVIDKHTVKVGDLVHVVHSYYNAPVTVFREGEKLWAETPSYDPETRIPTGAIIAEVTEQGLKNIRTSRLPGGDPPSVPDWQIEHFKWPHLLPRLLAAGKLLPLDPAQS